MLFFKGGDMAATHKTDLLALTDKEFAKLTKLTSTLNEAQALIKDTEDTSVKDIIAHRAHWIELFLGWYADGQAGKEVFFPAKGYKWNALKHYNADLRVRQADMDWASAQALLTRNHDALMAFLNDRSEEELYGGPMKGTQNHWTSGRWAEAAGPSHYRSATKYIRKRLREDLA
jgi:hypothetical protein